MTIRPLVGILLLGSNAVAGCPADLDGSGAVGFGDLTQLLGSWGTCTDCSQDLDGSGEVGFADLTMLLGAWGPCSGDVVSLRQDEFGVDASCWNTQDESCTSARPAIGSASNVSHTSYEIGIFRVTVSEPTTITSVRGVGGNVADDFTTDINAELNIWSSEAAAVATPFLGDVYFDHASVTLDTANPPLFGGQSLGGFVTWRYLQFTFAPFELEPGTYFFSLFNDGSAMGAGGMTWSVTLTDLGIDCFLTFQFPGTCQSIAEIRLPGTLAVDVFGHPTGE